MSLLIDAIKDGNLESVKSCLTEAIHVFDNFDYALNTACNYFSYKDTSTHNRFEIVKLLLAHPKVDPSNNDNDLIVRMCINNQVEILKLLLAHPKINPAHVNTHNALINIACFRGYTEIVRILLADGRVDPTINKNSPIKKALEGGYNDIVYILFNDDHINPDHSDSIQIGKVELVKVDNMLLKVEHDNPDTCQVIYVEQAKDIYLKWKYRIGGKKYNQARKELQN